MYDAILFPTDGSPGATRAFDHALKLAEDQGATLHVLHVVDVLSPGASLHETIRERMVERGGTLVETLAAEARERGVTVETAVREGDPAATIVDYASSEGVDVVVMPTHGRRELTKAVLGSVTDKVVRTGDVPVLVATFED
jgi:nucleotide-binding universal stress UspA family protein